MLYLNSVETESLTGPQAITKATVATMSRSPRPSATVVHFKVSAQGITLTDSQRRYAHSSIFISISISFFQFSLSSRNVKTDCHTEFDYERLGFQDVFQETLSNQQRDFQQCGPTRQEVR